MLTKQPQNITPNDISWIGRDIAYWVGVSSDGSRAGVKRIRDLVDWFQLNNIFLSMEPLMYPPNPEHWEWHEWETNSHHDIWRNHLDWLIISADTSPDPWPVKSEWIETILEAADEQQAPVFMKDNLRPHWPGELRQEWPEGLGGDDDE